jgi:hypothetical protein
MVAVERLNESKWLQAIPLWYLATLFKCWSSTVCHLPSENEGAKPIALPPSWPMEGRIQVRGLSIRYAEDMPDVLHELNLDIEVRDSNQMTHYIHQAYSDFDF